MSRDFSVMNAVSLGGLVAGLVLAIGLLTEEQPWRTLLLAATPLAFAAAWVVEPPRTVWLEGDELVAATWLRSRRLPLAEVSRVSMSRQFNQTFRLEIHGRHDKITFHTPDNDKATEELRRELGLRLARRVPPVAIGRQARPRLGFDAP